MKQSIKIWETWREIETSNVMGTFLFHFKMTNWLDFEDKEGNIRILNFHNNEDEVEIDNCYIAKLERRIRYRNSGPDADISYYLYINKIFYNTTQEKLLDNVL